ncbi:MULTISPECIES: hypothetical protein [unclassified Herbaspirillum]|uniref:hypothetical protein n=1 Tax=unclassified Herbaspirillum TaxID=2624150 RepID=UPI000E2F00FC|nr:MULTISPECIES: hypothetical protein [unclassified Herbaspirillum]RFB72946.1 hypothetical protein DZB54_01040 [Herbaspirillum sp. 3R-3a1]TFI11243.1 hypothetical protein E4P32_07125 [Herbaspirillum sp. 3R11]TFI17152.1 hypothetical protein E4P31_07125 [Herbaspirillum sp. 3R-11]TFI28893.1 hypothetical protein E4P30_06775 [Herbaspirillum sp. 3C11]
MFEMSETQWFFILLLVFICFGLKRRRFFSWSFASGANEKKWQDLIAQHGLRIDHQYRNSIGIDSTANKALVYSGDQSYLLTTHDVTGVQTDSMLKTSVNGWGMASQKDIRCRLLIKTLSMSNPIIEVRFHNKNEMSEWYQRLCVMFDLR